MQNNQHVYAVILAGGGGTRLWPTSRDESPKQFLRLTGEKTMMQIAVDRALQIVAPEKIIVVTNKRYFTEVTAQLPQVPVANIIPEPERKDTAMAMLVGAIFAKNQDPEAVVFNLASDHVVTNEAEFVHVVNTALEIAAQKKHLLTVGITPRHPSSAFGYIKIGSSHQSDLHGLPIFQVAAFTEKPDSKTAQKFIDTGKYFWNANMYVWSVEALLNAFSKYQPTLLGKTQILQQVSNKEFIDHLPAAFADADKISIDYAISEKADNLLLIPGDFGWDDVGDWKIMHELSHKDKSGNAVIRNLDSVEPVLMDAKNNLVYASDRLIALVGVEDLIVVDSKGVTMVIPRSQSQDVKKIVEQLKAEKKEKYL